MLLPSSWELEFLKVLAPEERHRVEPLEPAEHVARGDLPLALGDHPVLDANAFARMGVGPSGDVDGGTDQPGICA